MKTLFLDDLSSTQLSLSNMPDSLPASILTIGNFDGVHLGHQAMLAKLQARAEADNLATMVMIFEPQPREYFAASKGDPQSAPPRLASLDEKRALLSQFGVDMTVVARFDEAFRSLSATEFSDMLVNTLNVQALVLGDDFRFGNDRTGDSTFLRNYGLPVTNLHTVTDDAVLNSVVPESRKSDTILSQNMGSDNIHANNVISNHINDEDKRISSTRIRQLLSDGDIAAANALLGYDYSMTGEVLHGDKIGRTLDFPTANIALNRAHPALHGIYGVDVTILDDDGNVIKDGFKTLTIDNKQGLSGLRPHSLFGTANIGVRPSVDKPNDWRLEVYFPEFKGDLYGKTLNVRFLHYLHGERKYDGLEALKAGIAQDVKDLIEWRAQTLQDTASNTLA